MLTNRSKRLVAFAFAAAFVILVGGFVLLRQK